MARIFMRGFEQGHMMVDRRVTQGLLEADHLDDDQEHRFTQVALEADHQTADTGRAVCPLDRAARHGECGGRGAEW
jgi:hypothetical protein